MPVFKGYGEDAKSPVSPDVLHEKDFSRSHSWPQELEGRSDWLGIIVELGKHSYSARDGQEWGMGRSGRA